MNPFFINLFNLHTGEEDKQKTLEHVKSNISFRGATLWILACAIMVASVGLNVNSTAVVIGAMLISPLMGPIVGAGFALGTFDFSLLKKSLINLLIATIVSLIVSTLYFALSPFKEAQSELLARTSPNIYDVLIAFFGGLAGVIAITRVEKGNPIPGVAIATALMPPLCTAGYGLATGQTNYFFGALFLYSINCVFICIATFSIVKFLKYPIVQQVDKKEEKRIHYLVYGITFAMLLPSIYFGYSLFKEQQFRKNADIFIEKECMEKGNILIFKKLMYSPNSKKIELAFLRRHFTTQEIKELNNKLPNYQLNNTKLIITDNNNNFDKLKSDILNEVSKQDQQLAAINKDIIENTFDNKQIFMETQTLFPNINAIAVSKQNFAGKNTENQKMVVIYESTQDLSEREKTTLENWLKQKLNTNELLILKN